MNYHLTCIITCNYEDDDYTIVSNKSSSDLLQDNTTLYRHNPNEWGDGEDDELIDDVDLLNKILDLVE